MHQPPGVTARQRREGRRASSILDFTHAYVLHVTNASVLTAVERLRASGAVAYAAPNWTVTTMHTSPVAVTKAQLARAAGGRQARPEPVASPPTRACRPTTHSPRAPRRCSTARASTPYRLTRRSPTRPAVSCPGKGETITNVSLGTLTDASAASDPNDPCNFYATAYGPTTEIINGQRYIDWPSMPLIPTYTADSSGVLDPTGETCGDDPTLTEVGLDFSMMAPLPHDVQRPGHEGSGLTDLLGIAPGADYRLVLPSTPGGQVSDVDAAFLGAAMQNPRPERHHRVARRSASTSRASRRATSRTTR